MGGGCGVVSCLSWRVPPHPQQQYNMRTFLANERRRANGENEAR